MPKILVVDDEPNNRFLMEDLLSVYLVEGAQLLFAEDGRDALDLVAREHPRILFLDVVLPGRDGYDVCSTIRREHPDWEIYIVLLTAKGRNDEQEKAISIGADEVILKPFKAQSIYDVIRKVLGWGN